MSEKSWVGLLGTATKALLLFAAFRQHLQIELEILDGMKGLRTTTSRLGTNDDESIFDVSQNKISIFRHDYVVSSLPLHLFLLLVISLFFVRFKPPKHRQTIVLLPISSFSCNLAEARWGEVPSKEIAFDIDLIVGDHTLCAQIIQDSIRQVTISCWDSKGFYWCNLPSSFVFNLDFAQTKIHIFIPFYSMKLNVSVGCQFRSVQLSGLFFSLFRTQNSNWTVTSIEMGY